MTEFKEYVVMINYNSEGWKIWAHCSSFAEAVEKWREGMGCGNQEVVIMEPVVLDIRKKI